MTDRQHGNKVIRVGKISYLNTLPIFYHFEKTGVLEDILEFHSGPPALLNCMLRSGSLDVCISSSVEYAYKPDKYVILPDYCIGSRGIVQSVKLFSRFPIDMLNGRTIFLSGESDTSRLLCRIVLKKFFNLDNRFATVACNLEDGLERADAVLLIGDKAMAAAANAPDDIHQLDLGRVWTEATGLPFVYALWLARKDSLANFSSRWGDFVSELEIAHELVDNPTEDLLNDAVKNKQFIDCNGIRDYWKVINYRLDSKSIAGLKLFFRLGAELNEISELSSLEFWQKKNKISI